MAEQDKPTAYLGSPDGFSIVTRMWHYEELRPLVDQYFNVYDPWDLNYDYIDWAYPEDRPGLWTATGRRHFKAIEEQDLFIGILDGEPPDNGTVSEATWAAAHHKPVIGFRSDIRTT